MVDGADVCELRNKEIAWTLRSFSNLRTFLPQITFYAKSILDDSFEIYEALFEK